MTSSIRTALPLMLIAMSLIPVADTAGKILGTVYTTHPLFIAWSRFTLGAILLAPFVATAMPMRFFFDWRIWLRAFTMVGGITCMVTALRTEPMANVFGAFFVGPILAYFLSALFLREPITLPRTLLLLLGFVGVLLVVKPGFGMTPGLGFAVLAGTFYGVFLTAARWLAPLGRPRALLWAQLVMGALILAPFGLTHLPVVNAPITALTFVSALGSMFGNLLLITAMRHAPASRMAPFVYTQLVVASALGWLVFGDWPDVMTGLGLALLISTGLASLLARDRA